MITFQVYLHDKAAHSKRRLWRLIDFRRQYIEIFSITVYLPCFRTVIRFALALTFFSCKLLSRVHKCQKLPAGDALLIGTPNFLFSIFLSMLRKIDQKRQGENPAVQVLALTP
jgi:hypothetical protein